MIFGALGLVALIAVVVQVAGGDQVSSLHHLYLLPALWAALARGVTGGCLVGLVAGLVQALSIFPLIERAGPSWPAVDGIVSLATPLTLGLTVGRLVDRSRGRGSQLDALLDIQRSLAAPEPLGHRLAVVAELTRRALGVDRVRLVLESGGTDHLAASAPENFRPAETLSSTAATPCRRLVLPLDAGQGPAGAIIVERDGDLSTATCSGASALALHLALAIENAPAIRSGLTPGVA